MADKTIHPVIFNDSYSHNGTFTGGQYAELTDEQYECAKKLGCGFDSSKPLITDCEKRSSQTEKPVSNDKPAKV